MKKKVFISGPISGIESFNFPKFTFYKYAFEEKGMDVVSPADLAIEMGDPKQIQNSKELLAELQKKELEELKKCDCIFLLSGWENSKGSKKELVVAIENDLEIFQEGNSFRFPWSEMK